MRQAVLLAAFVGYYFITAWCTLRLSKVRYCYPNVSRPSDCPSVRPDVVPWSYCTGWVYESIWVISLRSSLLGGSHNIDNLVQGEHTQNSGRMGVGSLFSTEPAIFLKRSKIGPRLGILHTVFDYQNQQTRMTLNGHNYAFCFKIPAFSPFSEPTTKIWIKIDPHYQQRRSISLLHRNHRCTMLVVAKPVTWKKKKKEEEILHVWMLHPNRLRKTGNRHNRHNIIMFSCVGKHTAKVSVTKGVIPPMPG